MRILVHREPGSLVDRLKLWRRRRREQSADDRASAEVRAADKRFRNATQGKTRVYDPGVPPQA
jgi:hypothetical protein